MLAKIVKQIIDYVADDYPCRIVSLHNDRARLEWLSLGVGLSVTVDPEGTQRHDRPVQLKLSRASLFVELIDLSSGHGQGGDYSVMSSFSTTAVELIAIQVSLFALKTAATKGILASLAETE